AGWLYRAAVEGILGIERRGERVQFRPKLPSHWDGYTATLKVLGAELRVRVVRDAKVKAISLEVDGKKTKASAFKPKAGDKAEVVVRIPA
ncbi:MAG: hypothetical protein E5W00_16245, partial [Mesorhizobium sp.]